MCVCVRTVKSYDLARYAKQARPGPESTLLVISGPGRVYLAYRAKSYNLTVLTRLQDHQFEPCSPRIRQWSDEIGGQHPFELLSPWIPSGAGRSIREGQNQPWERTEARMGVRLLGRAMLDQLVVVVINYDFVRTVKSYDLARYAKQARPGPEST